MSQHPFLSCPGWCWVRNLSPTTGRSPQRFWAKEKSANGRESPQWRDSAKKHVFGPVLEVGADWGEFLEICRMKSGGTPAAAAQSALAPAPAPHNRDQKIIDF